MAHKSHRSRKAMPSNSSKKQKILITFIIILNTQGLIMTDKYRYKEGTKGGIYLVEERTKTKWKIIQVFYSVEKCRNFIKGLK